MDRIGQRPARRAEECLTDAELVAFAEGSLSEEERAPLHQHLDGCAACGNLLVEAVKALDPTVDTLSSRTEDDFAMTFRLGTVVAERYEIRRFIARGGMGEVYEAYDRELQERIALKAVSSAACDSKRAIRALRAEVALARRVTHPNVCRIYDLGTHILPSGAELYFLTMEFVDGRTLGNVIRRIGALPLEEAVRFARALLQGLAAAHAAGILHRDFKSDNVILRTDVGGRRTPVILDFGLARAIDERSRARSSQQAFVGTLTYMAPEQVEAKELTKGTDIYAFGVVWFEMLTGKLPFSGSPQLSALERLSKPPIPASELNPSIPPEIDEVLLRCLKRMPEERFQSAEDVLAAMPPDLVLSERPRSSRRRMALRTAAAGVAGAALAGVVVAAAIATQPESKAPKPRASLPGRPVPRQPPPLPSDRPLDIPSIDTAKPAADTDVIRTEEYPPRPAARHAQHQAVRLREAPETPAAGSARPSTAPRDKQTNEAPRAASSTQPNSLSSTIHQFVVKKTTPGSAGASSVNDADDSEAESVLRAGSAGFETE